MTKIIPLYNNDPSKQDIEKIDPTDLSNFDNCLNLEYDENGDYIAGPPDVFCDLFQLFKKKRLSPKSIESYAHQNNIFLYFYFINKHDLEQNIIPLNKQTLFINNKHVLIEKKEAPEEHLIELWTDRYNEDKQSFNNLGDKLRNLAYISTEFCKAVDLALAHDEFATNSPFAENAPEAFLKNAYRNQNITLLESFYTYQTSGQTHRRVFEYQGLFL